MIDAITNRDPGWLRAMADMETEHDPEAHFRQWQQARFMNLVRLYIAQHDDEFEAFSWEMYAQVRRDT
mgnify:CR=1 FL=1